MANTVQNLLTGLKTFVWDDDLRTLRGVRRVTVFVLRVVHMLLRELVGGQLNLRAMSLVYTTLLSIVPLLAVSFSVLKGFGYHERLESYLFEFLLEPLGPSGIEVADTIIGFVDNVKVGMLGSVGFALLIYTVIALVQKIESAFNFVWQIDRNRSLAQRFSNYLSVITIGPVLVFSAVGFATTVLDSDMARRLSSMEPLGTFLLLASNLVPYVLICLAFSFIYILIPNTRVQFRAALVGGILAGVLWKIIGWGFAAFIASSSKYAAIYSSFAILILLLIWLYLGWLVLLVGSQIAYFVQNPKFMTLHRVDFVLSNELRERLALQILYLVGYNHAHDRPPWQLNELIAYLDLPDGPVHRMLGVLVAAGYLVEINDDDRTTYLPVHDIGNIRLAEVLDAIRGSGESHFLGVAQMRPVDAVARMMADINRSRSDLLGEQSLKDLVLAGGSSPELPGMPVRQADS